MFNNTNALEVSIRMLDGATLRGTLQAAQNATVESVLAKDTPFLEFTSTAGQRKFLSKGQIAYVEPVEPLRKPTLKSKAGSQFADAFTLLGLQRGCTLAEAKAAYHRQAKVYHPDVFSGVTLPDEVARYVVEMFRQVNTAFTEVRAELEQAA